jgi:TatD DNase family protein
MFDTHAHLDFDDFNRDREPMLERARAAGIEGILGIGIDLRTSLNALAIARRHDWIWASAAVHPNSTAGPEASAEFDEIRKMVLDGLFEAVGETGMDLYRERSPRPVQEEFFRKHIDLALEAGRPLIIHCREAHEEVESVLKDHDLAKARVVMHCFGAPTEYAGRFAEMGCYISFAGNLTYKNAQPLRDAARLVPDELLLSETDCPFLAPVPMRGKRNEPALMAHTVDCLAEIRGMSREEMDALLTRNARKFIFGEPG